MRITSLQWLIAWWKRNTYNSIHNKRWQTGDCQIFSSMMISIAVNPIFLYLILKMYVWLHDRSELNKDMHTNDFPVTAALHCFVYSEDALSNRIFTLRTKRYKNFFYKYVMFLLKNLIHFSHKTFLKQCRVCIVRI